MKDLDHSKFAAAIFGIMVTVAIVTIVCIIGFGNRIFRMLEDDQQEGISGKHYAFIYDDIQGGFYKAVYEGAYKKAEEYGDYLENIGSNLPFSQNKFERMEIAIDAKVDGIIVDAGETEAMRTLINRADKEGIPVITVGSDSTSSARRSYVGFGYYDLGVKYGKELLKRATDEQKEVVILTSPDADDSSQNIIIQGIRETIERAYASDSFNIGTIAINDNTAFGAEESISRLIMKNDELPDIMICLNEVNTTCLSQALVDYNKVGQSVVYGFFENHTILSAIQKNIIYGTMTVDTGKMGRYCIETLKECEDTGYVNEYMPVDIRVVTTENINEYIDEKKEEGTYDQTG
ncbi:MAG: substrate-binding domain-containing protein [Lachnospiraceae bacterium]|nr:substrate-binding domain-containing protein [Lachnospiraceae bacterium]